MKLVSFVSLLCLCASCVSAAVTVNVTADPPLPIANLLQNPGFEQGNDMPDGWGISSGMPELFRFQRQAAGGRNGAGLRVDGLSSIMSGYLAQHLVIKPDTRYVGGAWLRLRAGHCLIWLLAFPGGQRWDVYLHKATWGGNPLVPNFVPLTYTASPSPEQWQWVGEEFTSTPQQSSLNFHVGSYFERGSMDFDDAFLGLARTTLKIRVGGEALRGVRVADETGKECWTSGDLPPNTATVDQELPDLPTLMRYAVTVTTAAGKEVAQWYPE